MPTILEICTAVLTILVICAEAPAMLEDCTVVRTVLFARKRSRSPTFCFLQRRFRFLLSQSDTWTVARFSVLHIHVCVVENSIALTFAISFEGSVRIVHAGFQIVDDSMRVVSMISSQSLIALTIADPLHVVCKISFVSLDCKNNRVIFLSGSLRILFLTVYFPRR